MNNIIHTNSLTMSSREIADLTGSTHDNVLKTIRALVKKGVVSGNETPYVHPQNGQTYKQYELDYRNTMIVVSGYNVELRARIIDRWMALEESVKNDPLAMLSDPAAMRGILLSYTEKVIELESRIEADKPKTQFFDQFMNADGLYGLQNAARALNCRPNLFIRWLKEHYLFYQGGNLVARVQFIQMGIFEVKTTLVDDKVRPQAFITPKGLKYLNERAPDDLRMRGAA